MEILGKIATIAVLFKMVSHVIIELLRKDGIETYPIRGGAGRGASLLLFIPSHANKWMNIWIKVANILYALSIAFVIIRSIHRYQTISG